MCLCTGVCACLDVGIAVALLFTMESFLIKKDWFLQCVPEGNLLHSKQALKQGSHEGNEVWLEVFKYSFSYTLKKKKFLNSNIRRVLISLYSEAGVLKNPSVARDLRWTRLI